jgi:N-carbamoylputrescine amidase
MRHLPARAFDNGLYVVACNQTGNNQSGLNFPGLSVILDPAGRIIKKNIGGKEDMIVADLRAEKLKKVRGHRMRYFLPNRRPDIY